MGRLRRLRGGARRLHAWYRTADLAKHTTALAAFVAAVSLAITAWGTWKSAAVADDQLTQSSQAQAEAERDQASRIAVWAEGDRIVVANRSLDPAYVTFQVALSADLHWPDFVDVGTVPPCTRVAIPSEENGLKAGHVTAMNVVDASGWA
ncbi:hypothetical protein [Streptomyces chartreusis]